MGPLREEFPPLKWDGLVRLCDKLNTLYLHLKKNRGWLPLLVTHDIWSGDQTEVTWPFEILYLHFQKTYDNWT